MTMVPSGGEQQPTSNDPYQQGWLTAVSLADWLRQGGEMPVQASHLVLQAGESPHCAVTTQVAAYHGEDVEYMRSGGFFAVGSSWKGLAATGLASAAASGLMNNHRKNKAEAQGAVQWRDYGMTNVQLTSHRVVFPIEGDLHTYWLNGGVISFEPMWDQYAALANFDGAAPIMFIGPAVPYLSVLMSVLLFRQIPNITA